MKWFDKWIRKQVKKALKAEQEKLYNDRPSLVRVSNDVEMDHRNSMVLKMQRAYGGTIIEVSDYDEHTDRYNRDLYIITAEQDLSTEIASILVQHNLRHG
jgi:hypothetical protein